MWFWYILPARALAPNKPATLKLFAEFDTDDCVLKLRELLLPPTNGLASFIFRCLAAFVLISKSRVGSDHNESSQPLRKVGFLH